MVNSGNTKVHHGSFILGAVCTVVITTMLITSQRRTSQGGSWKLRTDTAEETVSTPRVYPEHVEKMRDPDFHRQNKNQWSLQGYSRPYLTKEREAPCPNQEATSHVILGTRKIRKEYESPDIYPGDFTEGEKEFELARALDPKCLTARLNLIILLLGRSGEEGRNSTDDMVAVFTRVNSLFNEAFGIEPNHAKLLLWRGLFAEYNEENPQSFYAQAFNQNPSLKGEYIHPSYPQLQILRPVARTADTYFRRTLMQVLSFYEYAPALGAYAKLSYADTQSFLSSWQLQVKHPFLPPYVHAALVRTYRYVIDTDLIKNKVAAYAGAATYESNGDALNIWMNLRIKEFADRLGGTEMHPTYGYTAGYRAGDVLKPHTDRKACEFTLTLLLDAYPHHSFCPLWAQKTPWAINDTWIGRYEEETVNYNDAVKFNPEVNDMLCLRGRAKPHWRPAVAEHAHCTTFIMHYVPEGQSEK